MKDTDSDSGSANAPGTTPSANEGEGVVGAGHPERTPAPLRDLRKSRVSATGWLVTMCQGWEVAQGAGCCSVSHHTRRGSAVARMTPAPYLANCLRSVSHADLRRPDQELQLRHPRRHQRGRGESNLQEMVVQAPLEWQQRRTWLGHGDPNQCNSERLSWSTRETGAIASNCPASLCLAAQKVHDLHANGEQFDKKTELSFKYLQVKGSSGCRQGRGAIEQRCMEGWYTPWCVRSTPPHQID